MNDESESRPLWGLVAPWAMAAIIGSVVAGAWGALDAGVPKIVGGRRVVALLPLSGGFLPLQKESLDAVRAVAGAYWLLGGLLSLPSWRGLPKGRSEVARWCLVLAIGILFFVPPMLSVVWMLASGMGAIPWGAWGVTAGNHGPWRHIYDLRKILQFTLTLPWISVFLADLSFGLKPSQRAAYLSATSVAISLTLLWSHYWLID